MTSLPTTPDTPPPLVPLAHQEAELLARRAGVRIETLTAPDQFARAEEVIRRVWGARPTDSSLVNASLMRAIEHAGGHIGGVFPLAEPTRLVGVSVAFCAAPSEAALHSHVAGLLPGTTGRGGGTALKFHQRAWALERGFTSITWTYDPLIARNAHFNLNRLGATFEDYLTDFYGALPDRINEDEASDRGFVRWHLVDPGLSARVDHSTTPVPAPHARPDTPVLLGIDEDVAPAPGRGSEDERTAWVQVPHDTEGMREGDPALAHRWRMALRSVLVPLLEDGWYVTGYDRTRGYFVERMDG